jgi:type I restriction enzyme, S subunit
MTNRRVELRAIAEVTSAKRIFASDYVTEGVPFYRGKEITELHSGEINVSTALFIKDEYFLRLEKSHGIPQTGDILLTAVGTLGSVYCVKAGHKFYFKDGNIVWFRNLKGVRGEYLKYWLKSPDGRAELKKCVIGSSQSAYTIDRLKRMEIPLPSIPIQDAIVAVLGAYDDLIEVNRRRMLLLEEISRRLFEEWFVHFRFPGRADCQRQGDYSGEIPGNWRVAKVRELVERQPNGRIYRAADCEKSGQIIIVDQSSDEMLGYHSNEPDHPATPDDPIVIFGDHTCKMQLLVFTLLDGT